MHTPKSSRSWKESPLARLTVNLLNTYHTVKATDVDDDFFDLILPSDEAGLTLHSTYKLEKVVGKGSFGQVFSAFTTANPLEQVAIKVVKSIPELSMQARLEIRLLKSFEHDNIISLVTCFEFMNHQCLVFALWEMNLFELLKSRRFKGLDWSVLIPITRQLCSALAYLKEKEVIHSDLKPENIMFSPHSAKIVIVDFGSSCLESDVNNSMEYIQSRFYRAPEVLFEQTPTEHYSCALDMWSLGAILMELYLGFRPLFPGRTHCEQIEYILHALGTPPDDMIMKSDGVLDLVQQHSFASNNTAASKKFLSIEHALDLNLANSMAQGGRHRQDFSDLVHAMLKYRPKDRISPSEVLLHAFVVKEEVVVVDTKEIPTTTRMKRKLSQDL